MAESRHPRIKSSSDATRLVILKNIQKIAEKSEHGGHILVPAVRQWVAYKSEIRTVNKPVRVDDIHTVFVTHTDSIQQKGRF